MFSSFVLLAVIFNLMILCLDQYPLNRKLQNSSEICNIFFTLVLIIELVIKSAAYGITNYLRSSYYNQYDCYVVILSFIDVITSNLFFNDDMDVNSIGITVLRGFRIMRLFKLARFWRNFQILIQTLWLTVINTSSFTCLLFFVMFIYTLLGLEFFANKAKFNPETNQVDLEEGVSPMFNFDNFLNSFTTVFVILTNDG